MQAVMESANTWSWKESSNGIDMKWFLAAYELDEKKHLELQSRLPNELDEKLAL